MNNTGLAVLDKVKKQLEVRGSKTIKALGRTFRALDSYDGNRKVDREEFYVGLQENGVVLTKAEANALMDLLDTNGDGTLDFDEFLIGIRGSLNSKRQAYVDRAFLKFDKDGNGWIDINDIKGVYNAKMHPKVKSGEIKEEQVFKEFLTNFGDKNKDGRITKQEWYDYYAAVSASIDNDDLFCELMTTAWRLDPNRKY